MSKFNFKNLFKRKTNLEKAVEYMQKLNRDELRSLRREVSNQLDKINSEMIYKQMGTDRLRDLELGRALELMENLTKRKRKTCDETLNQAGYYDPDLENMTYEDNLKKLLSQKGICENKMDELAEKVFIRNE